MGHYANTAAGIVDGSKSSPTLPRALELIVRVPFFTSALAIRDAVSSTVLKRSFRISPGDNVFFL
ncbi:hypothetical protein PanWU01x14_242430 [Parasponia andersonii]|uniref:Uncharacterized protein n=1 Tax=Parasponia andersonii TaxID=3476 RepID=A0A2P5BFY7_PARAD|nr:hypothetical protein PanWU01x14_242430 [Parasponia andersonii]